MKIAIDSKNKSVSLIQIIVSFICGIGCAYLFAGLIMDNFSEHWVPVAIAIVAISGEKIGQWLIEKFNIEGLLQMLIDNIKSK